MVHALTPPRLVQLSPSFANADPGGVLLPGFGADSWNYTSSYRNPYNGVVGTTGWSSIAPAGLVPFESPININTPATDLSKVVTVDYTNAVSKQIINNSHQIQLQFPATTPDTVTVAGQVFTLSQFHYHDPAENTAHHRVDTMDEHFVNISASGAETVLAVFLKLGPHNNALDAILNAAQSSLTTPNSHTMIPSQINFAGLLPGTMKGWDFQGSLTTPPFSQPVNWFVFQQPITLDKAQLATYEQVARGSGFLPNARPVQSTDGRVLNQIDFNVNFQNESIAGLNFELTPRYPS